MKDDSITIMISQKQKKEIQSAADEKETSISEFIRQAVREKIERDSPAREAGRKEL
jgi:uncharacterized protein (DUF1778 family)